jgi:hypothetical protein
MISPYRPASRDVPIAGFYLPSGRGTAAVQQQHVEPGGVTEGVAGSIKFGVSDAPGMHRDGCLDRSPNSYPQPREGKDAGFQGGHDDAGARTRPLG